MKFTDNHIAGNSLVKKNPAVTAVRKCHDFQHFHLIKETSLSFRIHRNWKFYDNLSQTRRNKGSETCHFVQGNVYLGEVLGPWHTFLCKINKFGVPYFHEFATNYFETLCSY